MSFEELAVGEKDALAAQPLTAVAASKTKVVRSMRKLLSRGSELSDLSVNFVPMTGLTGLHEISYWRTEPPRCLAFATPS
jgi:hypothetical protein